MKRAKQDKEIITCRISPRLRNALMSAAKQLDVDMSKFARQAIREKLLANGVSATLIEEN